VGKKKNNVLAEFGGSFDLSVDVVAENCVDHLREFVELILGRSGCSQPDSDSCRR
jgi:hypothetical protein